MIKVLLKIGTIGFAILFAGLCEPNDAAANEVHAVIAQDHDGVSYFQIEVVGLESIFPFEFQLDLSTLPNLSILATMTDDELRWLITQNLLIVTPLTTFNDHELLFKSEYFFPGTGAFGEFLDRAGPSLIEGDRKYYEATHGYNNHHQQSVQLLTLKGQALFKKTAAYQIINFTYGIQKLVREELGYLKEFTLAIGSKVKKVVKVGGKVSGIAYVADLTCDVRDVFYGSHSLEDLCEGLGGIVVTEATETVEAIEVLGEALADFVIHLPPPGDLWQDFLDD